MGWILCKLGLHKSRVISFHYASWVECARCGKRGV